MQVIFSLSTKTTYVYLVHFGLIIIAYFTNPLIYEWIFTRIPSDTSISLRGFIIMKRRIYFLNHFYFDDAWKLKRQPKKIYNVFDKGNKVLKYMVFKNANKIGF